MARIKGSWVGQVVIEYDYDDDGDLCAFTSWRDYVISGDIGEKIKEIINKYLINGDNAVTVTQLHADLYRDESSEWTKEEATP